MPAISAPTASPDVIGATLSCTRPNPVPATGSTRGRTSTARDLGGGPAGGGTAAAAAGGAGTDLAAASRTVRRVAADG